MGDHKRAIEYYELSLKIMKKILGEEHPDTASSYNNIGNTYHKIGDYKRAIEYHELSLMIRKKILGEEHQILQHLILTLEILIIVLEIIKKH